METPFVPEAPEVLRRRASRARRIAAVTPNQRIANSLRSLAALYDAQALKAAPHGAAPTTD